MKKLKYVMPAVLLILHACNRNEPKIEWSWEDQQDQKQFFLGQSIPLKAGIYGAEKVDSLWLHIRPVSEGNWEYIYHIPSEQLHGNNPVIFEKEVGVPDTAQTGKYEIGIFAKLSSGSEIRNITDVQLTVDSSLPWIADLEVGLNGRQDDLHLAADISAAKLIEKITVVIKGSAWENSYEFTGKSIHHKVTAHFHEHVDLASAPTGNYLVTVILEDGGGRTVQRDSRFTKGKQ